MITKALILQRLLDQKQITAEEAIVLITADDRPVQQYPYPFLPNPWNPPVWYTTSTTTKEADVSTSNPSMRSSNEPVWGC